MTILIFSLTHSYHSNISTKDAHKPILEKYMVHNKAYSFLKLVITLTLYNITIPM